MSEEETDEVTPRPPATRTMLALYALLALAAVGALIAWHRTQDPARRWARRLEEAHATHMERPLVRCFGTKDPAAIRRVGDALARGELRAPLRDCHRGPAAELLVSPNAFVEFLQNPPQRVTALRDRERNALYRLIGSYRILEQALSQANGSPNAQQRERIAQRIESLSAELAAEQRALQDLLTATRDAASAL